MSGQATASHCAPTTGFEATPNYAALVNPPLAISISQVTKTFGRKTPAADKRVAVLNNLSLSVPAGQTLCLLGPSGCGKTTLVNLIMGIEIPSSGQVTVLGEQAPYPTVRPRIGFMPQADALYDDITAAENLRFFGTMQGMSAREIRHRSQMLLEFTRLTEHENRLVSAFSGGMKRRLSLAVAMLHSPDLLILDEPTVGLDPDHRRSIWAEFARLSAAGTTILVTTHVMDEATRCSQVALLSDGRIIAQGSPASLLKLTGTTDMESAFLSLVMSKRPAPQSVLADASPEPATSTNKEAHHG